MTGALVRRTAMVAMLAAGWAWLPAGAQQAPPAGATGRPAPGAAPARGPGACAPGQADCPRGAQRRRGPPAAAAAAPLVLAPASAEQISAADQVHYGRYVCEQNQAIDIDRNDAHPGYANLKYKTQSWVMTPVLSRSGAIRLEDVRGETLLVQIAFKSMLMNTKSGQRLVDECVHEAQRTEKDNAEKAAAAEKAAGDRPADGKPASQ